MKIKVAWLLIIHNNWYLQWIIVLWVCSSFWGVLSLNPDKQFPIILASLLFFKFYGIHIGNLTKPKLKPQSSSRTAYWSHYRYSNKFLDLTTQKFKCSDPVNTTFIFRQNLSQPIVLSSLWEKITLVQYIWVQAHLRCLLNQKIEFPIMALFE